MIKTKGLAYLALIAGMLALVGCATPKDYSTFKAADPKVILVLPPKNATPEVGATYGFYASTQLPIAESGFYVLPITLVDEHFRSNGLTVPSDIHQVETAKLREVFGADAALYINITDYGTRYFLVGSASVVTAEAQLVDLRNGEKLWTGKASASSEEGKNGQGGLAVLLISAVINQIAGTLTDQSFNVGKMTAIRLLASNQPNALIAGPRHPNYKK